MKSILCLFSDEKITERLLGLLRNSISNFDLLPIVFLDGDTPKYISDVSSFTLVKKSDSKSFVQNFDYSSISGIYCLFMTSVKYDIIMNAPININVVWAIPGGDLYNRYLKYFGYNLYYYQSIDNNIKNSILFTIKKIIRRIEYKRLISRINFVDCCECDYSQLIKYAHGKKPQHIYTFGYPIDSIMGSLYRSEWVIGNKIFVGNSASQTNNHLYILNYLRKLKLADYKIILPLSYGGHDSKYGTVVKQKYRETFSEGVEILTNFVPLNVYHQYLQEASISIFGNWRQEAVGNIIVSLYLGSKVYLSNNNPLYKFFINEGYIIFSLEDIESNYLSKLSIEEKEHNRHLCEKNYNSSLCLDLFKKGYSNLFDKYE